MTVKQLRDIVNSIPPTQDKNIVILDSRESFGFYELSQVDFAAKHPLDDSDYQVNFFDPYANEICTYDPSEFKNYDEYMKYVSQYKQLVPCVVLLP
jgi:hypothetical protein